MNSIAIWYETKSGDAGAAVPELDIHINHWKLRINKGFFARKLRKLSSKTFGRLWPKLSFDDSDYFLDIGLHINNGEDVSAVCIYVPFVFQDKGKVIEDIGERLKSPRILSAVFNEFYTLSTTQSPKYFEVRKSNVPIFNVYSLDIANDISIEKKYSGTILRFPFQQFNGLPTYYRLRLKSSFVTALSYVYSPSNSLFESASSSIEITDFRINDTRDLDVSLAEEMAGKGKFNIALIHYFIMRSVRDEHMLSNQDLKSVRQLEESTWASYITSSEYRYAKTFAYHLKQKVTEQEKLDKQYLTDFTAVFKFKFEDVKLIRYIFWFLVIAFAIELTANWLYDLIKDTGKLPWVK